MAGKKSKVKKVAARKPAAKRAKRPVAAAVAAPVAPAKAEQAYPCVVLISRGADRIPVTVGSRVQHARLMQEHGEKNLEVQK